jgi:hypothetical protein
LNFTILLEISEDSKVIVAFSGLLLFMPTQSDAVVYRKQLKENNNKSVTFFIF